MLLLIFTLTYSKKYFTKNVIFFNRAHDSGMNSFILNLETVA